MDAMLLQRWVERRDADAFRELALRYLPMVYGTCTRILRNPVDAEDVTQECFESLAMVRERVPAHVGAWLHRVATNKSLNALRSRNRRDARERASIPAADAVVVPQFDDLYPVVDEIIAQLPDELRLPLIAHFFEQRTHEAIADGLGLTRSAVTHRIGRAIERVREQLRGRGLQVPAAFVTSALDGVRIQAPFSPESVVASVAKLAVSGAPVEVVSGGVGSASASGIMVAAQKFALWAAVSVGVVLGGVVVMRAIVPEDVPATPRQVAKVRSPQSSVGIERDNVSGTAQSQHLNATIAPEAVAATENVVSTISGVVVDPSGDPARGVIVHGMHIQQRDRPPQATTDEQGRFSLSATPAGTWRLYLEEPSGTGQEPFERATVELADGQNLNDIRLVCGDFGLVISGVVRDTKRQPIRGAHLTTVPPSPGAMTNALGQYRLRGLTVGEYLIGAEKMNGGYMATVADKIPAGGTGIDFVLEESVLIRGRVIDASTKAAVKDYDLRTRPGAAAYSLIPFQRAIMSMGQWGITGDDGTFEIDWPLHSKLSIEVEAENYTSARTELDIKPGQPVDGIVIALESGMEVKGIVVDADGQPTAGAQIFSIRMPGPRSREQSVLAVTDDSGRFTVEHRSSEAQVLTAYHDECGIGEVIFTPQKSGGEPLLITLGGFGTVTGCVTRDGTPVSNVYVSEKDYSEQAVETDSDGKYRLEKVQCGARIVRYQSELSKGLSFPRCMFEKETTVTRGEESVVNMDIPSETCSVNGRIGIQDGCTVPLLQLTVNFGEMSARYFAQPTRDGTYAIDRMIPGSVVLRATMDCDTAVSRQMRTWRYELKSGERVERNFSFVDGAFLLVHLKGELTDDFFGTLALFPIDVQFEPEKWRELQSESIAQMRTVGRENSMTLKGAQPGTYTTVLRYVIGVDAPEKLSIETIELIEDAEATVAFTIE